MAEINLVIQKTPPIDIQIVDTPPVEVTMISTGAKGAKGDKGDKGDTGASIVTAGFTGDDITFTKDDSNTVVLPNAKIELKGDKGDRGEPGAVSSASSLNLSHITTPTTPVSGHVLLYAKNDEQVYKLDATGKEEKVGGADVLAVQVFS